MSVSLMPVYSNDAGSVASINFVATDFNPLHFNPLFTTAVNSARVIINNNNFNQQNGKYLSPDLSINNFCSKISRSDD